MIVVYFPAEVHEMCEHDNAGIHKRPYVKWGTVDSLDGDHVNVTFYEANHFVLIDGKPSYQFESDKEWKKLPKGWTYNTDLFGGRKTTDPQYEVFIEDAKNRRFSNPDDLLYCIGRQWFLPKILYEHNIEPLIEKGQYKIVVANSSWTLTYGAAPSTKIMAVNRLYQNYNDAYFSAVQACNDWEAKITSSLQIDKIDAVIWVLDRIPEERRDACRFVIENLSFGIETMFRVYEGKVLYRRVHSDEWSTVFTL